MTTRIARSTTRLTALVFVLALLAAACGQKEGVHVSAGGAANLGDGSFVADGGSGTLDDGTLDVSDAGTDSAGGGSGGSSRTSTKSGGGGGGGGSTGGGGDTGSGGGGGGGGLKASGSDRTGASKDCITLGIHAPATGAAPLPTTSFENFKDMYWRYQTEKLGVKILGRSCVKVLFRDDKYTPSSARQVCREMMDESFLVVGGGGTDQVQACGDLANESGVPYMSNGVTEAGLRGLEWYFAASMSYKQQADLLAQYVKKNLPGKSVMVATDTPNFDDAIEGWEAAAAKHGLEIAETYKHPKGDTSWYQTEGGRFKDEGVKNIYFLSSPVDYIQFADKNSGNGFQYMGVGVTQGLNAILPTGCDTVNGGIFFSPFPGLDKIDDFDPDFKKAAQALGLGAPDDIALALWNLGALQHEMFKRYEAAFGTDLTREDFRAIAETMTGLKTKSGPPLSYSPADHFGADQVHVLKADCTSKQYKTQETFKSGF
ncbi:MAG: ABC transporter substrate-binding protein [Actinobacteria bacterium]|nr:ABC transporter substrate-binding protein [Actinomycetota bacterium]